MLLPTIVATFSTFGGIKLLFRVLCIHDYLKGRFTEGSGDTQRDPHMAAVSQAELIWSQLPGASCSLAHGCRGLRSWTILLALSQAIAADWEVERLGHELAACGIPALHQPQESYFEGCCGFLTQAPLLSDFCSLRELEWMFLYLHYFT